MEVALPLSVTRWCGGGTYLPRSSGGIVTVTEPSGGIARTQRRYGRWCQNRVAVVLYSSGGIPERSSGGTAIAIDLASFVATRLVRALLPNSTRTAMASASCVVVLTA